MIERFKAKIHDSFSVIHLDCVDESHAHRHHKEVLLNALHLHPTHLRVTIVSHDFGFLNLLERHRLVYDALKSFWAQGLHALNLHLFTPDEWQRMNNDQKKSCSSTA